MTPVELAARIVGDIESLTRALPGTLTPPEAYGLLGQLAGTPLPDLLERVSSGLASAASSCDLCQDDGTDPAAAVEAARVHLIDAVRAATALDDGISAAKSAIAWTSVRG